MCLALKKRENGTIACKASILAGLQLTRGNNSTLQTPRLIRFVVELPFAQLQATETFALTAGHASEFYFGF
jgi:hypothetical protein